MILGMVCFKQNKHKINPFFTVLVRASAPITSGIQPNIMLPPGIPGDVFNEMEKETLHR